MCFRGLSAKPQISSKCRNNSCLSKAFGVILERTRRLISQYRILHSFYQCYQMTMSDSAKNVSYMNGSGQEVEAANATSWFIPILLARSVHNAHVLLDNASKTRQRLIIFSPASNAKTLLTLSVHLTPGTLHKPFRFSFTPRSLKVR